MHERASVRDLIHCVPIPTSYFSYTLKPCPFLLTSLLVSSYFVTIETFLSTKENEKTFIKSWQNIDFAFYFIFITFNSVERFSHWGVLDKLRYMFDLSQQSLHFILSNKMKCKKLQVGPVTSSKFLVWPEILSAEGIVFTLLMRVSSGMISHIDWLSSPNPKPLVPNPPRPNNNQVPESSKTHQVPRGLGPTTNNPTHTHLNHALGFTSLTQTLGLVYDITNPIVFRE